MDETPVADGAASAKKCRVLVVEDDAAASQAMTRLLASAGHEVLTGTFYQEAQAGLLRSQRFR